MAPELQMRVLSNGPSALAAPVVGEAVPRAKASALIAQALIAQALTGGRWTLPAFRHEVQTSRRTVRPLT